mgnify:CR=1 FL=1
MNKQTVVSANFVRYLSYRLKERLTITMACLGRLLKSRGLKVMAQKLDPYVNVDPGTMNPFEHGEVYVSEGRRAT